MSQRSRTAGHRIETLVDLVVRSLFYVACLAVVLMESFTLFEIVMRYLFDRPTRWVSDTVGYLLSAAIMLGLPEVTLRQDHVAITVLSDRIPRARAYARGLAAISAATCFAAGYLAFAVAKTQFAQNLLTQGLFQIPKAWIGATIGLGFGLTGAVFLVLMLRPKTDIG